MLSRLQQNLTPKQATAVGLLATAFWSSVIGLIRTVSLHMGAVGGAAMMYSMAAVLIFIIFGRPNLSRFSKSYLFWASLFFVGCELCLSLSVGYAQNARQTVEVGMVNYLWPTFTIIGAVLFNRQPAKWWIALGFILSFAGIAVVLGGEGGFSVSGMIANIRTNPTSYIMALSDALFWAAYCTLTARIKAQGNAVGFFFLLVCRLEHRHFARQHDRSCRRILFHPNFFCLHFILPTANAPSRRVLAGRGNGLPRFIRLLAGNAHCRTEMILIGIPYQTMPIPTRIFKHHPA